MSTDIASYRNGVGLEAISISSALAPSLIYRIVGKVIVEERSGFISIKGFPTNAVLQAMKKHWNTAIIAKHIFKDINSSYVKFHSFFALEINYILSTLLDERQITPGYRAIVRKVLEELKVNTWIKNIGGPVDNKLDEKQLSHFKKTPLPAQSAYFDVYNQKTQWLGLKGYLLSAAPGLGKTISSLMLMEQLKKDIVIVICLKSALDRPWHLTFDTEFTVPKTYWSSLENNTIDNVDYDYILVHYEAIAKLFPILPLLKEKNVGIILDESHNFNDPKSERSQNFLRLVEESGATDTHPMSGTPVKAQSFTAKSNVDVVFISK